MNKYIFQKTSFYTFSHFTFKYTFYLFYIIRKNCIDFNNGFLIPIKTICNIYLTLKKITKVIAVIQKKILFNFLS
jgi:hypothetical protein